MACSKAKFSLTFPNLKMIKVICNLVRKREGKQLKRKFKIRVTSIHRHIIISGNARHSSLRMFSATAKGAAIADIPLYRESGFTCFISTYSSQYRVKSYAPQAAKGFLRLADTCQK